MLFESIYKLEVDLTLACNEILQFNLPDLKWCLAIRALEQRVIA